MPSLTVAPLMVMIFTSMAQAETEFVTRIYDKYGFTVNNTQQISNSNLTLLVNQVLDGRFYNNDASICENNSCQDQEKCFSPALDGTPISSSDFASVCPKILFSLTQNCIKAEEISDHNDEGSHTTKTKPSSLEVWGYGLLFVTLINLCSLAGIFVLPLMNKSCYSTVLMFLIALAVGSLAANGILVLIPEAFEIIEEEGYMWRACVIVGGVYLFFITERILKMITDHCVSKRNEDWTENESDTDVVPSIPTSTFVDINRSLERPGKGSDGTYKHMEEPSKHYNEQAIGANGDTVHNSNGTSTGMKVVSTGETTKRKKPVATVAWMIIFGDAFHNFIDGLSIGIVFFCSLIGLYYGAAFSDSILLGISICIAVLCEELPHELGDFAILLNAGMTKKKALLFNFLSACTCYLGLIIGITISEVANATPWILGLAGGMFLYIALADMMPEMNHAAEEHKDKPFKVFFIQNAGFLCGFGVILLVSHYGAMITLG